MYRLVRSTVNQLVNMSAAGRWSPSQDDATILLYSVLRQLVASRGTVHWWHTIAIDESVIAKTKPGNIYMRPVSQDAYKCPMYF